MAQVYIGVLQGDDVRGIAHVLLAQMSRADRDFVAHKAPFWCTLLPSCSDAGGLTRRASPPYNPSTTSTAVPDNGAVLTAYRTARPSTNRNTAPWCTALDGIEIVGLVNGSDDVCCSSAMKATLAFISGRRYASGRRICTFTW